MSSPLFHRRGRALASSTAVAALVLAGLGAGSSAAPAAPPIGDCATPYPVAQLTPGEAVTGLTVSKGTTPEQFTGQVIGVLENGIAPDVDMVMMRLTSPEIDRVGGIWQGMSGSPVYAADGRLIGAVAYGLSYGPSPVAGITPYDDMDNYLASPAPRSVALGDTSIRAITRGTTVTRQQARQGFSQLKMPLGISGVSSQRLAQIQRAAGRRTWMQKDTYSMAAPIGAGVGPESIIAGGNVAAAAAYGDVTLAQIGTATSVCNGRVVGFGHPLSFSGRTTLTLHPASVLYVQEDALGPPFKVANLGAPVGTVTDDRQTGITGTFGALPTGIDISSTVSYGTRSRTGSTSLFLPEMAADTTLMQFFASYQRVLDGIIKGSAVDSWSIQGRNPNDRPFTLNWADRHQSTYDVSMDSAFELADFIYALTSIPGVSLNAIHTTSAVVDSTATWEVSSIEQRRGGAWVRITKKKPARVKAGSVLRARAVLEGAGGTRMVPVKYRIPRKAAGTQAILQFLGGNTSYPDTSFTSVAKARKVLKSQIRNDAVLAEFATPDEITQSGGDDGGDYGGDPGEMPKGKTTVLGRTRAGSFTFDRIKLLGPTDRVVGGYALAGVDIR